MIPRNVFITGATGYIGRVLIPRLLDQMVNALVASVETKPDGVRILEVPAIKALPPGAGIKVNGVELARS